MRSAVLPPFVLVVALLAGCQDPGIADGNGRQCIAETCEPEKESQDYLYALNQYGLHQVSASEREEFGPLIEGDLISWQVSRRDNGTPASDILGWDIAGQELIPIGASDCYHQTLNYQSEGRVVFSQDPAAPCAPDYPGGAYMVLWDQETRQSRVLDPGLNGTPYPEAFDGSWVVFMIRGSNNQSENGYWAHNVDDGRNVFLYPLYDHNVAPDGALEAANDVSVSKGHAFVNLVRNEKDKPGGEYFGALIDHDLDAGTSREVVHMNGVSFHRSDASTKYVVFSVVSSSERWIGIYDRMTNESWVADNPAPGEVSFPRVGGDWAVFSLDFDDGGSPIYGYHIPTRTMHELIPDDGAVLSQTTDTDGTRLVAKMAHGGSNFDSFGVDVYWMDLPVVE